MFSGRDRTARSEFDTEATDQMTDAELIAIGQRARQRYVGGMQVRAEDPTRHYPCCDDGCRPLTNMEMMGLLALSRQKRETAAAVDLEAIAAVWGPINRTLPIAHDHERNP